MQSVSKTLIQLYMSRTDLIVSCDRYFFDLFLKIPQLHPTIPLFIFTISVLVIVHPTDEAHGFFSSTALENRLLHSTFLNLWTLFSLLKPFPPLLHDILTPFSPILNWNQLCRLQIIFTNLICFTSPGSTFFLKCRVLNKARLKALQPLTPVWGSFLVLCRLPSSSPTLRLSLAGWDSWAVFAIQHHGLDVGQGLLPTGTAASFHTSLSRLSTQQSLLLPPPLWRWRCS